MRVASMAKSVLVNVGHTAFGVSNGSDRILLSWRGKSPIRWSDLVAAVKKNQKDFQSLRIFNAFRKKTVDFLVKEAIGSVCINDDHPCVASSFGSNSCTSDYDISISGRGKERVVKNFNRWFRRLFGMESAVMFDTNVYGISFLDHGHKDLYNLVPYGNSVLKYVKVGKGPENRVRDVEFQRRWALVKLLRYDSSLRTTHRILRNIVNLRHRPRQLSYDILSAMDLFDDLSSDDKHNDIETSNREYERLLECSDKIRREMESNPRDMRMRTRYKDSVSLAQFYGSETYYTQGALFHVLGKIQMKVTNLQVTDEEYMDSFIENIADVFKVINHRETSGSSNMKFVHLTIDVSKYWFRALDAILRTGGSHRHPFLIEMKTILPHVEKILRFRGKKLVDCVRGMDNGGDFQYCIRDAKSVVSDLLALLEIQNTKSLRGYYNSVLERGLLYFYRLHRTRKA